MVLLHNGLGVLRDCAGSYFLQLINAWSTECLYPFQDDHGWADARAFLALTLGVVRVVANEEKRFNWMKDLCPTLLVDYCSHYRLTLKGCV